MLLFVELITDMCIPIDRSEVIRTVKIDQYFKHTRINELHEDTAKNILSQSILLDHVSQMCGIIFRVKINCHVFVMSVYYILLMENCYNGSTANVYIVYNLNLFI